MGEHDAPAGLLERWQDAEPVRLYLWSVASAVILAASVAGWLTAELSVAVTGVVAAVLMFGGAAAARSVAFAPRTVHRLLDEAGRHAEEQAERAYATGLEHGGIRTPDQVARELGVLTEPMPAAGPEQTQAMGRVRVCPYMDEDGRRCTLAEHPRTTEHQLHDG